MNIHNRATSVIKADKVSLLAGQKLESYIVNHITFVVFSWL